MNKSIGVDRVSIARLLAVVGALLFLVLAVKMGVESCQAHSAASLMSNWKGGTMRYQDGFKLTGLFTSFAGAFFYFAIRRRSNQ